MCVRTRYKCPCCKGTTATTERCESVREYSRECRNHRDVRPGEDKDDDPTEVQSLELHCPQCASTERGREVKALVELARKQRITRAENRERRHSREQKAAGESRGRPKTGSDRSNIREGSGGPQSRAGSSHSRGNESSVERPTDSLRARTPGQHPRTSSPAGSATRATDDLRRAAIGGATAPLPGDPKRGTGNLTTTASSTAGPGPKSPSKRSREPGRVRGEQKQPLKSTDWTEEDKVAAHKLVQLAINEQSPQQQQTSFPQQQTSLTDDRTPFERLPLYVPPPPPIRPGRSHAGDANQPPASTGPAQPHTSPKYQVFETDASVEELKTAGPLARIHFSAETFPSQKYPIYGVWLQRETMPIIAWRMIQVHAFSSGPTLPQCPNPVPRDWTAWALTALSVRDSVTSRYVITLQNQQWLGSPTPLPYERLAEYIDRQMYSLDRRDRTVNELSIAWKTFQCLYPFWADDLVRNREMTLTRLSKYNNARQKEGKPVIEYPVRGQRPAGFAAPGAMLPTVQVLQPSESVANCQAARLGTRVRLPEAGNAPTSGTSTYPTWLRDSTVPVGKWLAMNSQHRSQGRQQEDPQILPTESELSSSIMPDPWAKPPGGTVPESHSATGAASSASEPSSSVSTKQQPQTAPQPIQQGWQQLSDDGQWIRTEWQQKKLSSTGKGSWRGRYESSRERSHNMMLQSPLWYEEREQYNKRQKDNGRTDTVAIDGEYNAWFADANNLEVLPRNDEYRKLRDRTKRIERNQAKEQAQNM